MCGACEPVQKNIETPKKGQWRDFNTEYLPAVRACGDYIKAGILELYAGDGPLDTITDYFDKDARSAVVMHYFRCKTCGQFFTTGLFARGEPLLRVSEPPSRERLDLLWGSEGVYFQSKE